jgi:hypothetical protein
MGKRFVDLHTGRPPAQFDTQIVLQGYHFAWLSEQ